jgi:ligand-binding sensor domain-containing protein
MVFEYRRYMKLTEQLTHRVVEPAALRIFRWRGDPIARLLAPEGRRVWLGSR